MRRVAAVVRGRDPEALEQFLEVKADHRRERPGPADAAGGGELRLGRTAIALRPAELDAGAPLNMVAITVPEVTSSPTRTSGVTSSAR